MKQLRHKKKFTIIGSGLTFSLGKWCWENYPGWAETFKAKISQSPRPLFLGGSIHKNKFKQHSKYNFFEVISSSVGRNDSEHNPINNYGIIDFQKEKVEIYLHGAKEINQFHKIIDINSWLLS